MQILKLISLKHALLLAVVAFCAVLLPYINLYRELGEVPNFPIGAFDIAGGYYHERMQEVKDGYPFLGNPYFYEHRNELPPAFFLADWFAAIPLLFGASMMYATLIDFFIWSFLFLVLAYLLFRVFTVSPWVSFIGSNIVFLSVFMHMIRIVSMQQIYPFFLFFLITFIYWLKDPSDRKRIYFLVLSSALTAYIYTYAWQIVVAVLFLTPFVFFFTDRREYIRPFAFMFALFVLGSLPLIMFTYAQMQTPFYWETMQRIGLVNTRLPASAVVSALIWIPVMFLLWFVLSRNNTKVNLKKNDGEVFLFFVLTGTAMIGVTLSNIITSKELELPQHIERFTIIWLSFASVYSLYFFAKNELARKLYTVSFLLCTLLIGVLFFGNIGYFLTYGPLNAFAPLADVVKERKIQGLIVPLVWLNENIKEESVVWTDPHAPLNSYIIMMTRHYTLFRAAGTIHLASGKEIEERYLVANYFSLTEKDLEDDYHAYGGVGNAYHGWMTENRRVKLCRILRLDHFGHACGELTDRVSWKGKSYFEGLYDQYVNEIRPNIVDKLEKYHVSYIISDKETDSPSFKPETLPWVNQIYADGRFTIYRINYSEKTLDLHDR